MELHSVSDRLAYEFLMHKKYWEVLHFIFDEVLKSVEGTSKPLKRKKIVKALEKYQWINLFVVFLLSI